MKLAFLGAGNVATFFAEKLRSQFDIIQIVSATTASASQLAAKLDCEYATELNALTPNADVYIIAIPDDELRKLPSLQLWSNKLIIHSAGAVSLHELEHVAPSCGCIWPVFSIQKNSAPQIKTLPIVYNASDSSSLEITKSIAQKISTDLYMMDDFNKAQLHIAAVFSNNFSTYLYSVAEEICSQIGIPFDVLVPMIQHTATKLADTSPSMLQTGPARRHDIETIQKHSQLLENPLQREIYSLLTTAIQKKFLL